MITKDQAIDARYYTEIHYTGRHKCSIVIGPRGGYSETITRVRISGKCKTWKRDAERFHLPVMYGLYESGWIDEAICGDWHLASECPAMVAYNAALESGETAKGVTYGG